MIMPGETGSFLPEYKCRPGIPVDFYQDGSKHNVLFLFGRRKIEGM